MAANLITEKIQNFRAKYPEFKNATDDVVISVMMNKGILNEQEVATLQKKLSNQSLKNEDSIALSSQEIPKNTFKNFRFVELNENGEIDLSKLNFEEIKKKYVNNYQINGTQDNFQIFDKKNNRMVLTYSKLKRNDKDDVLINEFDNEHVYGLNVSKEAGKFQINSYTKMRGADIVDFIDYQSGTAKDVIKNGKMLFVKELHAQLTKKPDSFWKKYNPLNAGLSMIKNLISDIKDNSVNTENEFINLMSYSDRVSLEKFLGEYKKENGVSFLQDVIETEIDMDANKMLIIFLGNLRQKVKHANVSVEKINAGLMDEFFPNKESKDMELKRHKKDINAYNETVFDSLKENVAKSNSAGTIVSIGMLSEPLNDVFDKYPNLLEDIDSNFSGENKKDIQEILLRNIDSPNDINSNIIEKIMNSNFEVYLDANPELFGQIQSAKTTKEKEKLFVDLLRYVQEKSLKEDMSGQEKETISSPINGKIDLDFKQGNIGDCWLLASLMALKDKPEGQNVLNSLISYDGNNVSVNFKGVNKSYTISAEEIQKDVFVSQGDGDIRAIELAFDKYLQEMAKNGKESNINIDGNLPSFAMGVILGNSKQDVSHVTKNKDKKYVFIKPDYNNYDSLINDFNNSQKVYTFSFTEEVINFGAKHKFSCINTRNNQNLPLETGHAYSIVKADDEFIYFRNPHDSSQLYKMTKDAFKQFTPNIESAEM